MLNFLATNYIIQSPYHQGTHSQIKGSGKSKFYKLETFKTDSRYLEIEKSSSIFECLIILVKSQGVKDAAGSLRFTRFTTAEENPYSKRANTLIRRIHNEQFSCDEQL